MRRKAYLIAAIYIGCTFHSFAQTTFKSLNYLYGISGVKTVAGQHNREPNTDPAKWTTQIYNTTGRYPGLWSGDFLFQSDNIANRWTMIYEAKNEWDKGALINLMWHSCSPAGAEPCDWDANGVLSHLTDAQWTELITNGTTLNNTWKQRMDEIAVYLQYLKDNGVEVFFRPLHEMNQGAFWWGGRPGPNGTLRLYQITHDYLVNVKGLTNLIWVWDVQDLDYSWSNYNPGSSYWDIMALDVYSGDGYTTAKYNTMLSIAGNKPIAIGECATLPTAPILVAQPKWTFFMCWAELAYQNNTAQQMQDLYAAGNVLTRDEMPGWTPKALPNLALNKPVTVSSTETGSNIASLATDGSYGTRWSSVYSDPQWLYVDLGASYAISEVKITWESALGKDYLLQVSNDAINWTTVKTITGNTAYVNDHSGLGTSGRYVRMYGTARGTQWGYSIYEMEVYGTANVATVYQDCSYGGYAVNLQPGSYTLSQLIAKGVANDDISSLKVSSGYEMILYVDDNFSGNSYTFNSNIICLYSVPVNGASVNLNDVASSIIVRPSSSSSARSIAATTDPQNKPGLLITPNPVTDKAILFYNGAGSSTFTVSIFDVMGYLVKKPEQVSNKQQISLSGLSKGVYLVKVITGNKVITQQIIKQ